MHSFGFNRGCDMPHGGDTYRLHNNEEGNSNKMDRNGNRKDGNRDQKINRFMLWSQNEQQITIKIAKICKRVSQVRRKNHWVCVMWQEFRKV